MDDLISQLGKAFVIELFLGIKFGNEKYQNYKCYLAEPKINKEAGVIIFTCLPMQPIARGQLFPVKLMWKGSDIFFSADCYENPSERFKLKVSPKEELSKDHYKVMLTGHDGRDDIELTFYFMS